MYSFFITEINLAEAVHQLQNKATAMNIKQHQQKQKSTKPLPPNSNMMQAMYAFYVCADEEDIIVSKSFTSGERFSKRLQTRLIAG
jgi:hypothetical protein